MDTATKEYRRGELDKVGVRESAFLPCICITDEFGATKHLNVSHYELNCIKAILLDADYAPALRKEYL